MFSVFLLKASFLLIETNQICMYRSSHSHFAITSSAPFSHCLESKKLSVGAQLLIGCIRWDSSHRNIASHSNLMDTRETRLLKQGKGISKNTPAIERDQEFMEVKIWTSQ
jgi:hypothetical protein